MVSSPLEDTLSSSDDESAYELLENPSMAKDHNSAASKHLVRIVELTRGDKESFGFTVLGTSVSDVGDKAARQGLQQGDRILSIEGLVVEEQSHDKVMNLIVGTFSGRRTLTLGVRYEPELLVEAQNRVTVQVKDDHDSSLDEKVFDKMERIQKLLMQATKRVEKAEMQLIVEQAHVKTREKEIEKLKRMHEAREEEIYQLQRKNEDYERTIERYTAALADCEEIGRYERVEIEKKDEELTKKNDELEHKNQEITQKDNEIARLTALLELVERQSMEESKCPNEGTYQWRELPKAHERLSKQLRAEDLQKKRGDGMKYAKARPVDELKKAKQVVESATAALKGIKRTSLVEVTTSSNPPNAVKKTLDAMRLLLGDKAVVQYYQGLRAVVLSREFMHRLLTFKTESITPDLIEQMQQHTLDAFFTSAHLIPLSPACGRMVDWVRAQVHCAEIMQKQEDESRQKAERANAAAKNVTENINRKLEEALSVLDGQIDLFEQEEKEETVERYVELARTLGRSRAAIRKGQVSKDQIADVLIALEDELDALMNNGSIKASTGFLNNMRCLVKAPGIVHLMEEVRHEMKEMGLTKVGDCDSEMNEKKETIDEQEKENKREKEERKNDGNEIKEEEMTFQEAIEEIYEIIKSKMPAVIEELKKYRPDFTQLL